MSSIFNWLESATYACASRTFELELKLLSGGSVLVLATHGDGAASVVIGGETVTFASASPKETIQRAEREILLRLELAPVFLPLDELIDAASSSSLSTLRTMLSDLDAEEDRLKERLAEIEKERTKLEVQRFGIECDAVERKRHKETLAWARENVTEGQIVRSLGDNGSHVGILLNGEIQQLLPGDPPQAGKSLQAIPEEGGWRTKYGMHWNL